MEEEMKNKQREKAETAARRKRKRQEKENAASNKRKRNANKPTTDSTVWFCPYCFQLEKNNDNKVWLECDQYQFWYHADCAGYSDQST